MPLFTNERCWHYSMIGDEEYVYHMNTDVLYELNNINTHSAVNHGDQHRIHVIADFMPQDFFQQAIQSGQDFKTTVPPGLWAAWQDHK